MHNFNNCNVYFKIRRNLPNINFGVLIIPNIILQVKLTYRNIYLQEVKYFLDRYNENFYLIVTFI